MLGDVLVAAVVVLAGGVFVFRLYRVWTVTPPDDLTRIHAHLEGLMGEAGLNRKVLNIVHNGGTFGSRYSPPKRRYIVTLQKLDGSTETKTVYIEAGLFGSGDMTIGS